MKDVSVIKQVMFSLLLEELESLQLTSFNEEWEKVKWQFIPPVVVGFYFHSNNLDESAKKKKIVTEFENSFAKRFVWPKVISPPAVCN